jgi:catechol 2,3-dioxygenase-like lactoylglutathione lyase family enzyme
MSGRPLVTRLDSVTLYVKDLNQSLDFYRGTLGLQLVPEESGARAEITLPGGRVRFVLDASLQAGQPQVPGTVRLCFPVVRLEAAKDRMVEHGVPVVTEADDCIDVLDPDQYRVRLCRAEKPEQVYLPRR